MTRIAVYGAGGVGGYFGARLARAGAEVHFIARGAHLHALREHGLRVRSVKGDFQVPAQVTDDPADIGPCQFVLFCVKTFDTDAAAARLGPLVGDETAVVSLQNGVENEEKLARAVGEDHVMGGAAFIFAGIAEPGVIVHGGGPASITFGELDGRASQRARRLLAWCEQAGFQAELSASIKTVLWAKLAFIPWGRSRAVVMRPTMTFHPAPEHRRTHLYLADSQGVPRAAKAAASARPRRPSLARMRAT